MSNNKKILDNLVSRTKIYLIIILILLIVICIYNPTFIIPSIIIYIAIVAYSYLANNKRKSEISEHLQDLTFTVDSAAKNTLINSPLPLIILETDGKAFTRPWFGQLMTGPQLIAYLVQVNMWLERYQPKIEL